MDIVLKKPIISEKSMKMTKSGLYTFLVDKKARKPVIAQAVEKEFGVEVISVKTINLKEEKKQQRNKRGYLILPGYKKAVVQLKGGQKIALFETEAKVETAEGGEIKVKEKKSLLKGTKVKIEKGKKGAG